MLSLPTFANKMGIDLYKEGIVLIEVNGKPNLVRHSSYLTDFGIPHIIVYDSDKEEQVFNEQIQSLSESSDVKSFEMHLDFEEMLVNEIGDNLDTILTKNYGDIYTRYKDHSKIRAMTLKEKMLKWLRKSKPFAAKYIARSTSQTNVPGTIRDIINSAISLSNK